MARHAIMIKCALVPILLVQERLESAATYDVDQLGGDERVVRSELGLWVLLFPPLGRNDIACDLDLSGSEISLGDPFDDVGTASREGRKC